MKQPIKMIPGDELHLTALMAPFSLNLVTGQDRQHLLGYGRAAFDAGKASQCLHQIQEPAAAEQAAWHAGLDEGRAQAAPPAVAVPDGAIKLAIDAMELALSSHGAALMSNPPQDMWVVYGVSTKLRNAIAALAATPAADAPAWDGKLPERLQRALNELRIDCKTDAVSSLEFEVRSAFEGMHTSLATVKRLYHAAQKRLDFVDAAQPDPFAAAAPVVLPEPVDDSLSLMLQRLDSKSLAEWADVGMGLAENIALHVQGDCDLRADQARQKLRAHLFSPQPAASLSSALLATATGLPAQAVPVANCYSDDDGDTWSDCPDDCEFVEGRALGEEFELQASIRAWTEVFRVTKVPDETSDDYEVEPVSIRTTAAPQAQKGQA